MKKNCLLMICLIHFAAFSQNIGIGTNAPESKLHVKGLADISQLIIDANSTQSNSKPLLRFRNSTGNDLLWIHSDNPLNIFMGINAGKGNVNGISNTFIGNNSGALNNGGNYNAFVGAFAGANNTSGTENTAIGFNAMYNTTLASQNTAIGAYALYSLNYTTMGLANTYNTALGYATLYSCQQGTGGAGKYNTAVGNTTLYSNTTGNSNTAVGMEALYFNNIGFSNNSIGSYSLHENKGGARNNAMGDGALYNNLGSRNTGIGDQALLQIISGSDNTALGYSSGTSAGVPAANNTISIGNSTYLNGASNQAFFGGTSTVWNGGNTIWYTYSDARVKTNVHEDVKGLDFITRLHPVTYYRSIKAMADITGNKEAEDYPEKYDIEKIKFSGFLAQEVEEAAKRSNYVFNGITVPKNSRELYTLSYEAFVVPLVKAVQELNEELKSKVEILESKNELLLHRIEKLEMIVGSKSK